MLKATEKELSKIFFALGELSGRVVRLKEAEEDADAPDEDAVEALEEMDDIICGLSALFDSEDDSAEDLGESNDAP
jgi:hypothetical protein